MDLNKNAGSSDLAQLLNSLVNSTHMDWRSSLNTKETGALLDVTLFGDCFD